jgi:phosphoglycolate phosphatase-like HAD superfamily hydrolase
MDRVERNKRILVFDFDGVICNSIHDSFATALNTYIHLIDDHTLPISAPLTSDKVFEFEKEFPKVFESFSDLMPLANCAEDYLVLLSLIDQNRTNQNELPRRKQRGIKNQNIERSKKWKMKPLPASGGIHDQEEFDHFKKNFSSVRLNEYHNAFYEIRTRMRENDLERWLDLLPPFPGIPDTVRSLSNEFTLAISTSKDRPSVIILLDRYGLSECFQSENIFDKDRSRSKRDHMIRLREKQQVGFSRIHFIDDKVSHLLAVRDLGVHNYLACWGFNSEREVRIALKEGFTPIQLKDLGQIGGPISE